MTAGVAANWPSCNRIVENLCIELYRLFKSPTKMREKSVSRASLVLESYEVIRDKVTNNARIESGTRLQLFQLNLATICQWCVYI